MATRMPPIKPGSIAESPPASPQTFETPEEVGEGLGHAPGVPDPNPRHHQPRHGKRHSHPVVAVRLYHRRSHGRGYYADRREGLLGRDAEAAEFFGDGGEAIGLLQAGMADVSDGRWAIREGCDGGQGHHGVREGVHVDLDALEAEGALYLDGVGGELDLAAHIPQDGGEAEVALRGVLAEAG